MGGKDLKLGEGVHTQEGYRPGHKTSGVRSAGQKDIKSRKLRCSKLPCICHKSC